MRATRFAAAALLALACLAGPARAVQPDEQLADPKLEARAIRISGALRCVVCQNETIDESDAALAHDLRVILRERWSPATPTPRRSITSSNATAIMCC